MSQEKLHWYLMTFVMDIVVSGTDSIIKQKFSTAYISLKSQNITKKDIEGAMKRYNFQPATTCVTNSMYLGHMTEKEFLS